MFTGTAEVEGGLRCCKCGGTERLDMIAGGGGMRIQHHQAITSSCAVENASVVAFLQRRIFHMVYVT